ncbi:hypothetical protein SAMN05216389_101174 [Oceanobacillus limi]|uniref:Lipoprotein n=1 Tax=Oceanobacillus limi TaxID=930131 RepID=A0A1H9Y3Z0_9BACI|nr:hypothetical protein [Oceanobacillus limi]SES63478.1 hypothetical protein SAMN05216389_101174 [Oceanobacillus limi]
MKKLLGVVLCLIGVATFGCSNDELADEKPPEAVIDVEENSYETFLGSYCWGSNGQTTCVDVAGPKDVLREEDPIEVSPSDQVMFTIDGEEKPNKIHVVQIGMEEEVEVTVEDNTFTAPTEEGIYYYSYDVWWMDDKVENVSNGSASYHFALLVE